MAGSKPARWRLAQDESSHWYVIPADELEEFQKWDYAECEGGDHNFKDFSEYALGGSPYGVTFENWRDE